MSETTRRDIGFLVLDGGPRLIRALISRESTTVDEGPLWELGFSCECLLK